MIDAINDFLWTYVLVAVLLGAGLWFTIRTRGVQFTYLREMARLLVRSGRKYDRKTDLHQPKGKTISSFQAFAVSLASRVGTGNIAGVAIAIAMGGPGAVFWMWVVAIIGSSNAFIESTLAQLFKVRGDHSYRGGPAYYISKGIGSRWYAVAFAILITVTFGLAFNSVQANTIALAFENTFGTGTIVTAVVLTLLTLVIIFGGIQRIARFNEWLVPVMALFYILLALYVVATRISMFPHIVRLIFDNAFGLDQAMGGSIGMAMIMGVKRGLFSNEAGEGSTPNAAATAAVSHPVKQGLIQTLGVYVDTLVVCTATAFIILCSGLYDTGLTGIVLTEAALSCEIGVFAKYFLTAAIAMFAFSSIVANYYYGETNLQFISGSRALIVGFRLLVGVIVFLGSLAALDLVWALADITMALMTLCNIIAILILGRYAIRCLDDYRRQRRQGLDPQYRSSTIPSIEKETECW